MLHDSRSVASNRRDWLKAAAGLAAISLLDTVVGGAPADDLRAKARRNLRLGMSSDVYGKLPVAEAAARMKADGFSNVLCNLAFADARFDPLKPDWQVAEKITAALERSGLRISSLYGYHNIENRHGPLQLFRAAGSHPRAAAARGDVPQAGRPDRHRPCQGREG
jgi:hypothetical protein